MIHFFYAQVPCLACFSAKRVSWIPGFAEVLAARVIFFGSMTSFQPAFGKIFSTPVDWAGI